MLLRLPAYAENLGMLVGQEASAQRWVMNLIIVPSKQLTAASIDQSETSQVIRDPKNWFKTILANPTWVHHDRWNWTMM